MDAYSKVANGVIETRKMWASTEEKRNRERPTVRVLTCTRAIVTREIFRLRRCVMSAQCGRRRVENQLIATAFITSFYRQFYRQGPPPSYIWQHACSSPSYSGYHVSGQRRSP